MNQNVLNVLFSSDDNYAQHMGVAIYSLLDTNRDFELIRVFVIDNDISDENKGKLLEMESQFDNVTFQFIDFAGWKDCLVLDMTWPISVSSYARLFIGSMLPDSVDRVLYLDCDMVVCDSLRHLWITDLQGCVLGAVQDTISDTTKAAVGLCPNDPYFNAGMLLIDVVRWRNQDVEKQCLSFINQHNGAVTHHDQGTLNGILRGNWFRLSPDSNIMTIHYVMSYQNTLEYCGEHSSFYSKEDIQQALQSPTILHFTPSFTTRPWVSNCAHPLKSAYWNVLDKTPWRGAVCQKDTSKWYVKLINWKYRKFGLAIL